MASQGNSFAALKHLDSLGPTASRKEIMDATWDSTEKKGHNLLESVNGAPEEHLQPTGVPFRSPPPSTPAEATTDERRTGRKFYRYVCFGALGALGALIVARFARRR